MHDTVVFSGDATMLYDYLDGILNTVQFKDAAVRLGISNIAALETATRYLFDSVDNLVNPRSIADTMTSDNARFFAHFRIPGLT